MNEEKYECLMCHGTGKILLQETRWDPEKNDFDNSSTKTYKGECFRCGGSGYVDWITNITNNYDLNLEITIEGKVYDTED